jgi:hypothetical protein
MPEPTMPCPELAGAIAELSIEPGPNQTPGGAPCELLLWSWKVLKKSRTKFFEIFLLSSGKGIDEGETQYD